jgi:hypothetical protein
VKKKIECLPKERKSEALPKERKIRKWKPIYLVQIYRMVRLGISDVDICKGLKISRQALWLWNKERPELREAIALARKELADHESLPAWIYSRLTPELKVLWKKIQNFEKEPGGTGIARIELLLQDEGKRTRQQLFLYALCVSRFSPSLAMKKVNIAKRELDYWIANDLEFAQLVEEVQWHKGNFFEDALVKLVKEGNPAAILFANKTFNGVRGYAPKSQVDVNVSGQVMHGVLDLGDLMPLLTEATRLELLTAIRRRDAEKNPRLTVTDRISQEIADIVVPKKEEVG